MADPAPAGIYWCAGGHRCQPLLREHRSDPWPLPSRYGLLIATRVRRSGREQLELRMVVDLCLRIEGRQPSSLVAMVVWMSPLSCQF